MSNAEWIALAAVVVSFCTMLLSLASVLMASSAKKVAAVNAVAVAKVQEQTDGIQDQLEAAATARGVVTGRHDKGVEMRAEASEMLDAEHRRAASHDDRTAHATERVAVATERVADVAEERNT